MTIEQISEFETLNGQLGSFHQEIATLVKKSPNDTLNKFKLTLVNVVLERANVLLGNQRKPFQAFDQFDADALPSNSDVLVIVGQYKSALENLRAENIQQNEYDATWRWMITKSGGLGRSQSDIRTAPPKKISDK